MDDLQFVQNCVNQNPGAWEEFLDKYARLIYSYIHGVFRYRGRNASSDTINDIFQHILHSLVKDNFKKLRSFSARNGCSLATWLRQVAIHASIDYLRRSKPAISLDEENEEGFSLIEKLSDDSVPVQQILYNDELKEQLTECINILDEDEKYFIELHIRRNIALEELRIHLGISRSAIDMRKSRIVAKLRECFKKNGFLK
ncbi:MAG: sigma-70 family RNA polymerase sigma factor [Candidatus Omnitrophota bacterium]|jgi:RNA polymerase sigma-70 factor (ECF subfamily)|nr:MAG: sigma-70 family RNA polymerase sigma factor [Candidatus Omnitrophota bacterium]